MTYKYYTRGFLKEISNLKCYPLIYVLPYPSRKLNTKIDWRLFCYIHPVKSTSKTNAVPDVREIISLDNGYNKVKHVKKYLCYRINTIIFKINVANYFCHVIR